MGSRCSPDAAKEGKHRSSLRCCDVYRGLDVVDMISKRVLPCDILDACSFARLQLLHLQHGVHGAWILSQACNRWIFFFGKVS